MSWFLSPLAWLLLAGVLGAVAWRVRRMWLWAGCAVMTVAALAGMTPLVANWLAADLERPASEPAWCRSTPPAIAVVLSGGVEGLPRGRADFGAMDLASRRRVERGVQYWREHGGSRIILTGGATRAPAVAHADLMGEYARRLGLPERALILERRSDNTQESARNVAVLMPRLPRRIALVTSAMHMPRARIAFEATGFEVCSQPTDFRAVPVAPPGYLRPVSSALVKTESALHELVGIAYYRWRAWRRQCHRGTGECRAASMSFTGSHPRAQWPQVPGLAVVHVACVTQKEPQSQGMKT